MIGLHAHALGDGGEQYVRRRAFGVRHCLVRFEEAAEPNAAMIIWFPTWCRSCELLPELIIEGRTLHGSDVQSDRVEKRSGRCRRLRAATDDHGCAHWVPRLQRRTPYFVSPLRPRRRKVRLNESHRPAQTRVSNRGTLELQPVIEWWQPPGFRRVRISHDTLKLIVRDQLPSWRTALSSARGIYLVADTSTGGLCVGSACGVGGFWQRWQDYASSGHAGNLALRELLAEHGDAHVEHFQYAVLEVSGNDATIEESLAREQHWKDILMSRNNGLNRN
ncbi:MAG: GIY-YIG nuclease family protein [Polyangiaceae bacterium]